MSNIRVTYSGLITFVVSLISVFTGMFFVIVITRRLSPDEFGTWSLIIGLVTYFAIAEHIVSYWNTRQIARGEQVGKSSLVSSGLFSVAAMPLYLILAYFLVESSNVNWEVLIFGLLLVPVFYVSHNLLGINQGHKPQATSYALLIFEIFKIPAALVFVLILDLGILGVIYATLAAFLLKIAVQIYFAKPKLRDKFHFDHIRYWLKLSWIPLYATVPTQIRHADIFVYTFLTGSVLGIAYYSAALAIAMIVHHSISITKGLYPKLIAQGSHEYIRENFIRLFYFAIPLLGLVIIFSKPGLFVLNPAYENAQIIVILLAFYAFFETLNQALQSILLGIERVDAEKNPTFSQLVKSQHIHLSNVRIVNSVIYISVMTILLITLNSETISEFELVTWWALAAALSVLPILAYVWIQTKKRVKFSFPYQNIIKYVGATIAMIVVYILTNELILHYEPSIYDFFPSLIIQFSICVGVYLLITYITDKKTRTLFLAILNELKNKNRSSV